MGNENNGMENSEIFEIEKGKAGDTSPEEQDGKKNTGDKEKKGGLKAEIISWIQVIVAAVVIAFVLNNFVIANSKVPTGSMETTIMSGDRVIGSRLSYTFGAPERGDIAIFKFGWICENCKKAMGESPASEVCPFCGEEIKKPDTLYYVKRVIGVPGDVVEIRREGKVNISDISENPSLPAPDENGEYDGASVYVNGEKLTEDYLKEPMLYFVGDNNRALYETEDGVCRFEVPEGCYFMMGDNRNNSQDARFWNNPFISEDKIIAKVMLRYFPNPGLLD